MNKSYKWFLPESTNFTRRVRTSYCYPDGEVIDLFCESSKDGKFVTDIGETIRWLLSHTTADCLSEQQIQKIQDILSRYGVKLYQGIFVGYLSDDESFDDALERLASACIAIRLHRYCNDSL